MIDKAEMWISSYLSVRKQVDWSDFVIDLNARFKDEIGTNVVEQFNKLQQSESLETYIDEFEHLRSIMMQSNSILPDSYILDSFVAGLKPAVKPFVRAFKPKSIAEAVEYARLQEESLVYANLKPNKFSYTASKPLPYTPALANTKPPLLPTPVLKQSTFPPAKNNQNLTKTFKHIPADVRAEKIAKGLCYFCDQPYSRDHKCKFRENQLFTVEIEGHESEVENYIDEEELINNMRDPCISVNALSGSHSFHTMRIKGVVKEHVIHILVDSGSTHDFLDISLAKKLGCKIEDIPSQSITIADGNHLECRHVCKGFTWKMQGQPEGSGSKPAANFFLARQSSVYSRTFEELQNTLDAMKVHTEGKQILLRKWWRRKRMITNRESAARSRARKQAYTLELEAEVAKLKELNEDMQNKQILEKMNWPWGSKRLCLRRTLSATW